MEETKLRTSELEDRIIEMTQSVQQRSRLRKEVEQSLTELWDYNKRSNIYVIGFPEEEKEKAAEIVL